MSLHPVTPPERGAHYDSTRQTWETIWNGASMDVEMEAVQSRRAQETLRAYLPYLDQNSIILEAGSGLSAVVITLRRMGYRVVGLDYAENALHISRQYEPDLALVAGDVHALPYAENSIGAYLSFGVLEHFEQGMQPALREAYRILQPGGTLVLTIPYPNVVWRLAQLKRRLAGQTRIKEDFYESTYTREALEDQARQAGFTILTTQPTSHSFTLWGLAPFFRAKGYYRTNALAEGLGDVLRTLLPWPFNFMTLLVGQKPK
jgi:ubiquinone/menaquinone biosynthesis C-methylase UbiE